MRALLEHNLKHNTHSVTQVLSHTDSRICSNCYYLPFSFSIFLSLSLDRVLSKSISNSFHKAIPVNLHRLSFVSSMRTMWVLRPPQSTPTSTPTPTPTATAAYVFVLAYAQPPAPCCLIDIDEFVRNSSAKVDDFGQLAKIVRSSGAVASGEEGATRRGKMEDLRTMSSRTLHTLAIGPSSFAEQPLSAFLFIFPRKCSAFINVKYFAQLKMKTKMKSSQLQFVMIEIFTRFAGFN